MVRRSQDKSTCKSILKKCTAIIVIFGLIFCIIVLLTLCANYRNSYYSNMGDTVGHNVNFMAKNLNKSVADNLYHNIQILCCITINDNTYIKYIKYSWGKRCQKILFVGPTYCPTDWDVIQPMSNSVKLFQYIYKYHSQCADWFLWTQDNTYIIMENLRYLLYPYNPITSEQLTYSYKQGFLITEFGIILSKAALQLLVDLTRHNTHYYTYCVTNLALCLNELGLKSIVPDDKQCFSRFIPLYSDKKHISISENNLWYEFFKQDKKDCYPSYTVSLQLKHPQFMFVVEILLYGVHLYGINEIHPLLPEKYKSRNSFIGQSAK